jgi:hypothetical protein
MRLNRTFINGERLSPETRERAIRTQVRRYRRMYPIPLTEKPFFMDSIRNSELTSSVKTIRLSSTIKSPPTSYAYSQNKTRSSPHVPYSTNNTSFSNDNGINTPNTAPRTNQLSASSSSPLVLLLTFNHIDCKENCRTVER